MKKKSLWLITVLMTVALLGVFVMQLYYIREAYRLKSELFEQEVNQALSGVANKVQRLDAVDHILETKSQLAIELENRHVNKERRRLELEEKFKQEEKKRKYKQQQQIINELNYQDDMIRKFYLTPRIISEAEYFALSDESTTPLNVDVNLGFDEDMNIVRGDVRKTFRIRSSRTFELQPARLPDSIRYLVYSKDNEQPLRVSLPSINGDMQIKFKIEDETANRRHVAELKSLEEDSKEDEANGNNFDIVTAAAKEMREVGIPLNKRISQEKLNILLHEELQNKNINLDYDFWLTSSKDSVLFYKVSSTSGETQQANTYKTKLFSNDVIRDPGMLYVNFPDKNSLIFSNLSVTMASSAGLLLVLISIFSYTLYAILRQKKISEMKTDFINNMTHEFKTPVSTIMIASEALKDPEILGDKSRISRLAGIIYDENVRLGNHIERVLSIARLENKELKLDSELVDMNILIAAVAENMHLQLQKKGAELILELNAEKSVIIGDEFHLSNVIYNLIDNANKYSFDPPKITLRTRSTGKNFVLEVEDEGIGMTKEHSKRIFDQFYRVPTGNLHDVKGFGLGLNYVHDIIAQMGGTIKVQSEKDKGTIFEILIPLS